MDSPEIEPNDLIACRIDGDTMIVRFISPETRNPLSSHVLGYLDTIVKFCEADQRLREVIVTGTDDVFASGANLREIGSLDSEAAREFSVRGQKLFGRISRLPQKTIAAINGYCFGGALDLSLACDRRTASSSATFCHPGAGLGIITGWGGTQRLPRLIGEALTCEMFFTAEPISASAALSIGLIDVVDDEFVAQCGTI
jgi:enoyl-CoA hydratase